jgi:hypothetical protein
MHWPPPQPDLGAPAKRFPATQKPVADQEYNRRRQSGIFKYRGQSEIAGGIT